ncbi:MAG: MtaA/CmuA family methyltransferase [Nitrospinae bacterium]|nr:MtaA/CmuA family methyltransferase [Nitrospinota bacterium]
MEYMSGRRRFLGAVMGGRIDRPSVGSTTSVVTVDLMDQTGIYFPDAHHDPEKMAQLAATSYTILGYDTIAPVFSVQQEAEALGCRVNWGEKDSMPTLRKHPCHEPEDIKIPEDFLERPSCLIVLEAIKKLKVEYGSKAAIIGKVMGPWTLAYHLFGTEEFLIMTIDNPGKVKKILNILKEVTVLFGKAQAEAGADAITLADHATGELCSPGCYRDFLMPIHTELVNRIPCPIVLHICGNTSDRIGYICETKVDCFHFDSRVLPKEAKKLAGKRISLMGNVNNPETLYTGSTEDIYQEVQDALEAGIDIIGPECAVPLRTPSANLKAIADSVRRLTL